MKAITISQPYASLIADGEKIVENRTWHPGYTGPLAIHAGLGTQYLSPQELERYPTGKVLAVCVLVGCLHINTIRAAYQKGEGVGEFPAETIAKLAKHKHTEGPYCWLLEKITKLKHPVMIGGRQKLWNFDETRITE
ncbi:MAG TPA: ASCH domain-containing protein [Planctomicrobium sp.]|nr:ASCH domain-containing protein [Planctomicrobium sp.]